jgi:hypothetical protein
MHLWRQIVEAINLPSVLVNDGDSLGAAIGVPRVCLYDDVVEVVVE